MMLSFHNPATLLNKACPVIKKTLHNNSNTQSNNTNTNTNTTEKRMLPCIRRTNTNTSTSSTNSISSSYSTTSTNNKNSTKHSSRRSSKSRMSNPDPVFKQKVITKADLIKYNQKKYNINIEFTDTGL
ncbi:hypothetical protein AWRI3579_g4582 [Hanseniaspora osmophila]|uniref:Uncharacterized protein n=1 Tax=Hanseniaspora osmophila TaxID=56408 RepID=A0A1E5R0U5_9ASCO|nr:hypothetical protein AWRI3579_g4582 [Hanseniaspora osmophila]